jgi:hypothetical protein
MEIEKEVLKLIFPQGTLDWFDIIDGKIDGEDIRITLEEKDIPPLGKGQSTQDIIARKFHAITVTDFPLRGKRTLLTFRRRYWKLAGQKEYLKRDIKICFPGTQLEQEFAVFLKDDGGKGTVLAGFYRKVSKGPSERI